MKSASIFGGSDDLIPRTNGRLAKMPIGTKLSGSKLTFCSIGTVRTADGEVNISTEPSACARATWLAPIAPASPPRL
jgi:hypothetical protein